MAEAKSRKKRADGEGTPLDLFPFGRPKRVETLLCNLKYRGLSSSPSWESSRYELVCLADSWDAPWLTKNYHKFSGSEPDAGDASSSPLTIRPHNFAVVISLFVVFVIFIVVG